MNDAVEAVRSLDEIKRVQDLLAKHGGQIYADIWTLGVNVGLRISDLLKIRMSDPHRGQLKLREGKTKKTRVIDLNATAAAVIKRRQKENPEHEWLFQVSSNRSSNKPIDRSTVARKFQEVGDIVGVRLGTHSMRKTLGWQMHSNGAPIERICQVLNHSSPAVTMRYIGLIQEDIKQAYSDFEIRI